MIITKKVFFTSLILLILFLTAAQLVLIKNVRADDNLWQKVQQGGLDQFGTTVYNTQTPKDIRMVVILVVKAFLGLIGTIFLINIVIAGYKWMTAAGNEDSVAEAKKYMSAGVIGLIIVLMSWALAKFIVDNLYQATQ